MARIFISHSSTNNAAALAVAEWLRDNGWGDYFLDVSPTRGLAPGERWQEALKAAAHRCEAVLFLVSPAWRDSRWCLAEFLLAKSLGKVILGVIVEPMPIETLLPEMTVEWQLCDLANGDERLFFTVSEDPIVPRTRVSLARAGLERLKRGLLKAGLDPSTFPWPPPHQPDRSPYPGLRPLEAEDAAVFFGRDAAIVRGLDEVRSLQERGVERMLVILGASGAGKSSFLRAGLWPRLLRDDRHFLPLPVVRPERAAISGTSGLAASLEAAFRKNTRPGAKPRTRAELRATLRQAGGFDALLRELQGTLQLSGTAPGPAPTVVFCIDQAEELFTAEGRPESEELLSRLGEVLAPPRGEDTEAIDARRRCLAILAIRSDSYERLQTEPSLVSSRARLFDLRPMEPHEYKAVIEGPAERASSAESRLKIDPRLTERLLADTEGADALPLLAFTLERLFVQCGSDGDLTLEEYRELGAVRGSIAVAIDGAFAHSDRPPQSAADAAERERLLRLGFIPWLARVDPDTEERKRRVARWDEIPEAARPLLARLVEARLLTRDRRRIPETDQEADVVEIAHEALLRQWPSLSSWLDEEAGNLKAAEAVRRAAREFVLQGRRAEWLLHTGERLANAESLMGDEGFSNLLAEEGRSYLLACRQRDEVARRTEEEARRRELETLRQKADAERDRAEAERRAHLAERRRYRWTRGFAAVTFVLLVLAAWSYRRALSERERARQALAESDFRQAVGMVETDPAGALAHVARAMRLEPGQPAPRSLAANLLASAPRVVAALQHQGRVNTASFSPDGTRVVTASEDNTAQVWDVRTGEAISKPLQHQGLVRVASFSPDGSRIVTASQDNTARVWDARTGEPLSGPLEHGGAVYAASFSPDGTRIATASADRTARVWDGRTGEPLLKLSGHRREVSGASFSPDGTLIVTACSDRRVRLWDARTGEPVAKPIEHEQPVRHASFSPDGTLILTTTSDQTGRIVDARTGERLPRHLEHVIAASFSPDGTRIAAAFADSTARVWDAHLGQPLTKPLQHQGAVYAASFSPDGNRIVTASADKTARVWDARTGEILGKPLQHEEPIYVASFSPDGTRILTASSDDAARVWDARTSEPAPLRLQLEGKVLAFSPDGARIVTTSSEEVIARVWDALTGKPLSKTLRHEGRVSSASFSPDGTHVVTTCDGNTAHVWDARTGESLPVLLRHQGPVNAASFSPDGKRIVTASTDKTARVWDARSGEPLWKPVQHQQPVAYAAFGPDGARIVTVSLDNTVRVWDARTGAPPSTPFQHESGLPAPFSLDDTRIVTMPSVAPVWNAQTVESLLNLPRRRGERSVSSPDGTRVVTASFYEDAARLWNGRTGDVLSKELQHQGRITAVSFSPDSARIVTASEDATARLWDARTGEPLARPFRHGSRVTAVVFSADGTRILTTCSDDTAWVWDTPVYSEEEVPQLVELAEAVGGETLSELGGAVPLFDQNGELVRLRTRYDSATEGPNSVASFARWLFADPWTRTISSLSALTVPEYICDAIRRGAVEEVRKAFPDHPLLRGSEAPAAIPPDCLTARERAQ